MLKQYRLSYYLEFDSEGVSPLDADHRFEAAFLDILSRPRSVEGPAGVRVTVSLVGRPTSLSYRELSAEERIRSLETVAQHVLARDDLLEKLKGISRDDLVKALRPHGSEIREADEWRPIAAHVRQLLLAQSNRIAELEEELAENEEVINALGELLRLNQLPPIIIALDGES